MGKKILQWLCVLVSITFLLGFSKGTSVEKTDVHDLELASNNEPAAITESPLLVLSTNEIYDSEREATVVSKDLVEQIWTEEGLSSDYSIIHAAYNRTKDKISMIFHNESDSTLKFGYVDLQEESFALFSDEPWERSIPSPITSIVWSPDGNQVAFNMLTGYSGDHTYYALDFSKEGDIEELKVSYVGLPFPIDFNRQTETYFNLLYSVGGLEWSNELEAFTVQVHRGSSSDDRGGIFFPGTITYVMDAANNVVYPLNRTFRIIIFFGLTILVSIFLVRRSAKKKKEKDTGSINDSDD